MTRAECLRLYERRLDRAMASFAAAAADGSRAPSNQELAEILGVGSVGTVSNLVGALERRGLIQVTRLNHARIVKVVATGKSTAAIKGEPHWRLRVVCERRPRQVRSETAPRPANDFNRDDADVALRRVDRDPCPRCGVRGDIGCAHSARPIVRMCSL